MRHREGLFKWQAVPVWYVAVTIGGVVAIGAHFWPPFKGFNLLPVLLWCIIMGALAAILWPKTNGGRST